MARSSGAGRVAISASFLGWMAALSMAVTGLEAQQGATAAARAESTVQAYMSDLIVHVKSWKRAFRGANNARGPVRGEDGAGIVVGMDSGYLYVATAKHVVTVVGNDTLRADSVWVEFEADTAVEFVTATIDVMSDSGGVDLAVLKIRKDSAEAAGYRPVFDRLGDSGTLSPGADVLPVGCPGGNCWSAPSPPDRVLSSNPIEILFQTSFVRGGSSGGGLFDEWEEVVGMVYRQEPPGAYALPMDFVVSTIEGWGRPVTIRKPRIPRRGYPTTLGITVMAPTSGGRFPSGRVPSGRLTLTFGLEGPLDINVSALRIAPKDVGAACPAPAGPTDPLTTVIALRDRAPCEQVVNAFVAGLGVPIKAGRWVVRPFGELGMGRVRGRYDIGGVYEVEGLEYVPNLKAVEQTGFGGGAGVTVDVIVFPRTILQGIVGYWRFQDPFEGEPLPAGYKPDVPTLFVGLGVRMGL